MVYALGLDIAARIAFDTVGEEYNTNWCVFVHFFDYIAWSAVYLHVSHLVGMPLKFQSLLDRNRKLVWYMSLLMGFYYAIQSFIQLTYINESWYLYNEGLFQRGYEFSHSMAIGIGIAVFTYFKFIKKKIEKYRWA